MSQRGKTTQVTVRLTPYEAKRLDVLRRRGVPYGARLRGRAPCVAEAVVHLANEIEAGRIPGMPASDDGKGAKKD